MANTVVVNRVERGAKQFQGAFTDMWTVTSTVSDQDAVAINDTLAVTMTVPGVVLGDMVIGTSLTLDSLDAGGDGAVIHCEVTAADTVSLLIHADVAEFAADSITGAVIKVLVGRPSW